MKFIYFTLPDGKYLVMNNLQSEGEFKMSSHETPTIFPYDTEIDNVCPVIKNCPDIKAILSKTFTV